MISSRAANLDPSSYLRKAILVILGVLVVGMNSGFSKPIWIDEYLHFAFGALTLGETLAVIRETTGSGVNWGQTGTYFLVSHFTGSFLGPSLWALRLPSILSGLVLLAAGAWFMRCRGFGIRWQVFAVVTLASQSTLMYFVGEARPYLPMAASVTAALAFLATPAALRGQRLARALGWSGIVLGSILHPYWLPFVVAVAVFALWVRAAEDVGHRIEVREFLCLPLLVPAVVLYLVMARLTWANGTVTAVVAPLQFMGTFENVARSIASTHLSALVSMSPLLAVLAFIALFGLALGPRSRLRLPVAMMVMGLTSSAALAALSYARSYWILQRQWVGGIALVGLGLAWVAAELWSGEDPRFRGPQRALALVLVAVVGFGFAEEVRHRADAVQGHREVMADFQINGETTREALAVDRDFVRAANINSVAGGSIWREHAGYYGRGPQRRTGGLTCLEGQ